MIYKLAKIILSIIFNIIYRIEVIGIDNMPKEGRLVICSNHISNLDPIILGITSPRTICFMAKKELFNNKLFAKLLIALNAIPIDRESSDLTAIRKSLNVLKEEKALGIFPEGTRVDKMDLDSAKAGVGLIAVKGKTPVIPVFIDSNYKIFSKIRVNIGKPINLEDYYGKKLKTDDYIEISKDILSSIYDLEDNRGSRNEDLYR